MEKNYVIGVDYGTDSARAILVDAADGSVVAARTEAYPRWAEGRYSDAAADRFRQHPKDYLEVLETVLKDVVGKCPQPENIRGISVDTTASTPCLTDERLTPLSLTPGFEEDPDAMFVLWKDHTGMAESREINALCDGEKLPYTCHCGYSYSAENFWSKILHIFRTNPRVAEKAWSAIECCDFVTASLTGCHDLADLKPGHCCIGAKWMWAEEWGGYPPASFFDRLEPRLKGLHLPEKNYGCHEQAGTLCPEWAAKLGLGTDVVVGVGNCDAHSGAVGAGVRPGVAVLNMGTSACYMAVMPVEEMKGNFIEGLFGQAEGTILEGFMGYETGLSAFGDIFAWFKRLTGKPLDELAAEASVIGLRDDLPLATDFFNGRRAPNPSNIVTASISGLRITTGPAEIYRALVEAAAFGSKACIDQYLDGGIRIDKMIAVGGIAQKSPYVMQTLCDVLGSPIEVSDCKDACAMGAAIHAAVAAGLYGSVLEAEDAMCPGACATYTPDPERHEFYLRRYRRYNELAQFVL